MRLACSLLAFPSSHLIIYALKWNRVFFIRELIELCLCVRLKQSPLTSSSRFSPWLTSLTNLTGFSFSNFSHWYCIIHRNSVSLTCACNKNITINNYTSVAVLLLILFPSFFSSTRTAVKYIPKTDYSVRPRIGMKWISSSLSTDPTPPDLISWKVSNEHSLNCDEKVNCGNLF